jgi:hypothetical protein
VFGTLVFFSELAMVINLGDFATDTQSKLEAGYKPWPYDQIPPINIAAFFSDIQREIALFGTPEATTTVEVGPFWIPPTATPGIGAETTLTAPAIVTITSTPAKAEITLTPTKGVPTGTPVTPTKAPTITATPITPTNTPTTVFQPINTSTPVPEPESTHTPTPVTPTPIPTFTKTTPPPVITPNTPTTEASLPPPYYPVRPIAENNGESTVDPGGQGCLGYFGYRNDNTQEVDIPLGALNFLSDTPVSITPDNELPTHFLTDRVSPAFEVVWNTSGPLTWNLDGRTAVLQWCNP